MLFPQIPLRRRDRSVRANDKGVIPHWLPITNIANWIHSAEPGHEHHHEAPNRVEAEIFLLCGTLAFWLYRNICQVLEQMFLSTESEPGGDQDHRFHISTSKSKSIEKHVFQNVSCAADGM